MNKLSERMYKNFASYMNFNKESTTNYNAGYYEDLVEKIIEKTKEITKSTNPNETVNYFQLRQNLAKAISEYNTEDYIKNKEESELLAAKLAAKIPPNLFKLDELKDQCGFRLKMMKSLENAYNNGGLKLTSDNEALVDQSEDYENYVANTITSPDVTPEEIVNTINEMPKEQQEELSQELMKVVEENPDLKNQMQGAVQQSVNPATGEISTGMMMNSLGRSMIYTLPSMFMRRLSAIGRKKPKSPEIAKETGATMEATRSITGIAEKLAAGGITYGAIGLALAALTTVGFGFAGKGPFKGMAIGKKAKLRAGEAYNNAALKAYAKGNQKKGDKLKAKANKKVNKYGVHYSELIKRLEIIQFSLHK